MHEFTPGCEDMTPYANSYDASLSWIWLHSPELIGRKPEFRECDDVSGNGARIRMLGPAAFIVNTSRRNQNWYAGVSLGLPAPESRSKRAGGYHSAEKPTSCDQAANDRECGKEIPEILRINRNHCCPTVKSATSAAAEDDFRNRPDNATPEPSCFG
jgi:hypothetical protein